MALSTWNSPSKNAGVGSHLLLQGIFPTQRSNPGLLHVLSEPPLPLIKSGAPPVPLQSLRGVCMDRIFLSPSPANPRDSVCFHFYSIFMSVCCPHLFCSLELSFPNIFMHYIPLKQCRRTFSPQQLYP